MNIVQGTLQSITYIIAAIDISTRKEIWKAELTLGSISTPSDFGRKIATAVYEKLKSDKVL